MGSVLVSAMPPHAGGGNIEHRLRMPEVRPPLDAAQVADGIVGYRNVRGGCCRA